VSYRIATVDELQDISYRQDTHMRPVRHHLGITAFGTNAWTSTKEGDRLMPEHAEDEGVEELYVVLRGRARFEIGDDRVDAPAGALIFVGPETSRTAFAVDAETTVLAVGSRVGKPYEAGGWEVWAEFHPAYEAGDYEGVIKLGRTTLEASGYQIKVAIVAIARKLDVGEARARLATARGSVRAAMGETPTSIA